MRPRAAGAEEADVADEVASDEADPAHEETTGRTDAATTGATIDATTGRQERTDLREEPDPEGEG